jgi:hypothetical protein
MTARYPGTTLRSLLLSNTSECALPPSRPAPHSGSAAAISSEGTCTMSAVQPAAAASVSAIWFQVSTSSEVMWKASPRVRAWPEQGHEARREVRVVGQGPQRGAVPLHHDRFAHPVHYRVEGEPVQHRPHARWIVGVAVQHGHPGWQRPVPGLPAVQHGQLDARLDRGTGTRRADHPGAAHEENADTSHGPNPSQLAPGPLTRLRPRTARGARRPRTAPRPGPTRRCARNRRWSRRSSPRWPAPARPARCGILVA